VDPGLAVSAGLAEAVVAEDLAALAVVHRAVAEAVEVGKIF